jgi:Protein of unknown function (DUF3592)
MWITSEFAVIQARSPEGALYTLQIRKAGLEWVSYAVVLSLGSASWQRLIPEVKMARPIRSDISVGRFLTALGLLLLAGAWWTGNRLKSWPAVDAEVTKSEVSKLSSFGSRNGYGNAYSTKIEFRFEADGEQFTVSSSEKSASHRGAQSAADMYTPGTRHTTRYNPANPNDISFNAGYFDVVYTLIFFLKPIFLGIFGLGLTSQGMQCLWRSRSMRP